MRGLDFPIGDKNSMKRLPVRNIGAIVLSCVSLLAAPLFARESTDVIIMKNGDHRTGEIKGLNVGVLYMSMKYILGTSSVEWSSVVRLESKQLFLVKTEDGSVYTGALNTTDTPSGRPMEIAVVESSGKEVLNSARIVEMDTTSTKFLHRFNGNINTGTIHSKGNPIDPVQLGLSSCPSDHVWRWFRTLSEKQQRGAGFGGWRICRAEHDISTESFPKTSGAGLIAANLQFFRFNKTNGSLQATLMPVVSEPSRVKFNMNAS